MIKAQLVSSLEKVFPKTEPKEWQKKKISGLYGETLSFQIAYCGENENIGKIKIKVKSSLQDKMKYRLVGLVPSNFAAYTERDENYITGAPGLFPDVLFPITPRMGELCKAADSAELNMKLMAKQWRSVWVDIALDKDIKTGDYLVKIMAEDDEGNPLLNDSVSIEVIGAELPKQELFHTEWFHADCLADYYKVEVFGERHWQILENFIVTMVKHGINTLLTPIFTPPLDTQIGGERTTVQLVGVECTEDGYRFDFSQLERWLTLAFRLGMEYIEISHLFTQWGAKCAPKIMARKDGVEKKIFGWEDSATGKNYQEFLQAFLPKLTGFLEERGIKDRVIFHISDEPGLGDKKDYLAAKNSVKDMLAGYTIMDALSSYEMYQEGVVETPVVATDHIKPYLENKVKDLWVYYCCAQKIDVANRFMAMPSARNRILGVQLYKYDIKGFLHWGYNFYNSQFSLEKINPYYITDAGEGFPSGDAFLVYPGENGEAVESLRLMILSQALQDIRALSLLESLTDKDFVMKLIESDLEMGISFFEYPKEEEYLFVLREKVNAEIAKRIHSVSY